MAVKTNENWCTLAQVMLKNQSFFLFINHFIHVLYSKTIDIPQLFADEFTVGLL